MHPISPPHEIRTPPPRFRGDPGPALPPAVLAHALEGARCAPRRRHRIWGTWTPNLSARFPAALLTGRGRWRPDRQPLSRRTIQPAGRVRVAGIGSAAAAGRDRAGSAPDPAPR